MKPTAAWIAVWLSRESSAALDALRPHKATVEVIETALHLESARPKPRLRLLQQLTAWAKA